MPPSLRRLRAVILVMGVVLGMAAGVSGGAARAATSPAAASARGLDVFISGPASASSGAELTFALRALGYRTVLEAAPVEGATIDLSWDPSAVRAPPPPVRVETDGTGRATASLRMPPRVADESSARLFVTVRHGTHARTRSIDVARQAALELDVIVPDSRVIPGSRVGAWVRVRDRAEGRRLSGIELVAEMQDGGVARDRSRATTDATGSAMVFLRVPDLPDGAAVDWVFKASLKDGSAAAGVSLSPREEVAAQPDLDIAWDDDVVEAGGTAIARARLRDASLEPLAGELVEYVVTPIHPEEESPDDWEAATKARTDPDGRIVVRWAVPPALPGGSMNVRIAVRTTVSERTLERSARFRATARSGASFEVIPEAGALVPGLAQRLLLRARGDDGKPIVGRARAVGDGLAADVELDARGEAEMTWTPPGDVGSRRDVGTCARNVAATVTLEEPTGRLARRGGRAFACVVVDRTRGAIVHVEPTMARAGQKVRVRIASRVPGAARRPTAITIAPADQELGTARALWIADGEAGAEVQLPAGPGGVWNIGAFAPRDDGPALGGTTAILVAPTLLPRITARVVGGRIAPGGEVEVEARLTDEAGRPVDGLVGGFVFDAFGGGSSEQLERLDARVVLCEATGLPQARCADVWSGGPGAEPLVRSALASTRGSTARVTPVIDPASSARADLDKAFQATLKSLEGAVFEASSSPERLVDARRDGPRGRTFNPELFRIVTDALADPPTTPGGEPLELADLTAIDPQVRFDVVARRVTRLKVFRVLQQVRAHRHQNDLDLDEPALADPNALLARLTASEKLEASALLDPWGGTMVFRRAQGRGAAPLIASLPGWELASPGADGRAGTGDDVVDPFERVLKSDTPYARALDEDAVVLARGDVRIADATVEAWAALLEEKTGTSLGNQGHGSGHGRLGGSHRTKPPSVRMGATMVDRRAREPAWELPARTRNGVVRLRMPLGSADTTYRIVVVGLADGGEPAIGLLDVPIATPIAARIDAGDRWTEGDVVEVAVRVRNRTARAETLVATIAARGDAALAPGQSARQSIAVPARGAALLHARVRALRPELAGGGKGTVEVSLQDQSGRAVDAVRTTVPIELAGRRMTMSRARWLTSEAEVPVIVPAEGERALGPVRVVIEGGLRETLAAALGALEPDRLSTADALVDAIETASRAASVAAEQGPGGGDLARRAQGVIDRARGRLAARKLDPRTAVLRRTQLFVDLPGVDRAAAPCEADAPEPPTGTLKRGGRDVAEDVARAIALLQAEPPATEGAGSSCWEAIASGAADDVGQRGDPLELARLVLAFSERPHRRAQAKLFAARLARVASLQTSGYVALPAPYGARRDARALVLAALARVAAAGVALQAPREALFGWLMVQRDATGGFGSPEATRAAVAALVADAPRRAAPRAAGAAVKTAEVKKAEVKKAEPVHHAEQVEIVELDEDGDPRGAARTVRLGQASLTLAAGTAAVRVTPRGGGVLVRLEREMQVRGAPSAELLASPLRLTVGWPDRPRAGRPGVVEVAVRSARARDARTFVRLPLPVGVSLAEPVDGVRAVPGALLIDLVAEADDDPVPKRIPVRFALAGEIACPEASARLADEASAPAWAQAPRLVIRR